MPTTPAQRRATLKYHAAHWRQLKLSVPIPEAEAWEKFCKARGIPRASLIRRLVNALVNAPPSLVDAIVQVSEQTGETPEALVQRHMRENLYNDVFCLVTGIFKSAKPWNKKKLEGLSALVLDGTGYAKGNAAPEQVQWMFDHAAEPGDDEIRELVKDQSNIIYPGDQHPE